MNTLVQTIYQQLGAIEGWTSILAALSRILRPEALSIVVFDRQTGAGRVIMHHAPDEEEGHTRVASNSYPNARSCPARLPPAAIEELFGSGMKPSEAWPRSIALNARCDAAQHGHCLFVVLHATPSELATLCLKHGQTSGGFIREHEPFLRSTAAHLANRVALEKLFERQEHRARIMEAALETHRTARAVISTDGRLIRANRQARAVFAQRDGLAVNRIGRLIASEPGCAAALGSLGQARQRSGAVDDPGEMGPVRIDRPSGKPPYLVMARPCRSEGFWTSEPAAVLLMIHDPDEIPGPEVSGMLRTFALTEAEAEVAWLLMQGMSAVRIGQLRSVAMPTVRSQIRGILEKTSCTTQLEFVSLAFRTLGTLFVGPRSPDTSAGGTDGDPATAGPDGERHQD